MSQMMNLGLFTLPLLGNRKAYFFSLFFFLRTSKTKIHQLLTKNLLRDIFCKLKTRRNFTLGVKNVMLCP